MILKLVPLRYSGYQFDAADLSSILVRFQDDFSKIVGLPFSQIVDNADFGAVATCV